MVRPDPKATHDPAVSPCFKAAGETEEQTAIDSMMAVVGRAFSWAFRRRSVYVSQNGRSRDPDAEELFNEAGLRISKQLPVLKAASASSITNNLFSYAVQVADSVYIDSVRKKRSRRAGTDLVVSLEDNGAVLQTKADSSVGPDVECELRSVLRAYFNVVSSLELASREALLFCERVSPDRAIVHELLDRKVVKDFQIADALELSLSEFNGLQSDLPLKYKDAAEKMSISLDEFKSLIKDARYTVQDRMNT